MILVSSMGRSRAYVDRATPANQIERRNGRSFRMLRRTVLGHARLFQQRSRTRMISSTRFTLSDDKNDADSTMNEETTTSSSADEVMEVKKSEWEALRKDNEKLNDQLLRALAETENVRRIAKQDVRNAKEFSIGKFAKSLLDVADNLQRAHQSISIEELHPEHSIDAIKSLHEGVVMTDHLLLKTFKEFGVVPHGEVGEKFDPNLHDAMFEYHDEEKDCGTIGQVVKTGYLISSRVLRPAQVGTIKKKD